MTTNADQPWSRRVLRQNAENDENARLETRRDGELSPAPGAEPLDYMTQQRPPRASDDADAAQPPTQQMPAQDAPRYRMRDYTPEGRRRPSWAPTYTDSRDPYPSAGERLDYRTQQRPGDGGAGAAGAPAGPEGAADEVRASETPSSDLVLPEPVITQTMTRRELRRLREEQFAAARPAQPEVQGPIVVPSAVRPDAASTMIITADDVAPHAAELPVELPAPTVDADRIPPRGTAPERPSWAPARYFGDAPATDAETDAETTASAAPTPDAVASSDVRDRARDRPDVSGPGVAGGAGVFTVPPPASAGAPTSAPWLDAPPPSIEPERENAPASDAGTETAAVPEPTAPEAPSGSDDLDAWVAEVYGEQSPDGAPDEPTGRGPVALVEPPEPQHWNAERTEEALTGPAVLGALFTPPVAAEPTPRDEQQRLQEQESSRPDPLAFLDRPAPGERFDAPAPDAAAPDAPAPDAPEFEAVDQHEAERERTSEPQPEIVIDERGEVESSGDGEHAEPHPIVIDATPLPAEPLPLEQIEEHREAAADLDAFVASRDVVGGHGVITTNALVLPSIPQQEISGPLTTTGEILITGSIDLPMSLSSTGAHPMQLDQSSLDHELDPGDSQVVSTESQPVRAIKAVSTHTSTRGMMTSTKPKGNRGLTILIVSTGGLAVVVAGLLIAGLATHTF